MMNKDNYQNDNDMLNNGDSRWSEDEEIESSAKCIDIASGKCDAAGVPLKSDGQTAYVDDEDTHTAIFGATGSMKTRRGAMPLLGIIAQKGESVIATDPKGELQQRFSGLFAANGYNTNIIDFRNPSNGDNWNPFALPHELYHNGQCDEANWLANDFINAIAEPQRACTKEVSWTDEASQLLLAYVMFFIETSTYEKANLYNFICFLIEASSVEKLKEIFELMTPKSVAALNLGAVMNHGSAERTINNIAGTANLLLRPFKIAKALCRMMAKSSFDIRSTGKEKTAIFIVVPDEKPTLHFLATMFIKQAYEILIQEAQKQDSKKLPIRVNFILDEFGNLPKIPDCPAMFTAARSREIRFFIMAQGLRQLGNKYGDDADTIIGNCENIVYLYSRETDLLKMISELCGDTTYTDIDGVEKKRPLISISELQRLSKKEGQALILHGRHYPYMANLPDIDEYKFKKYPSVEIKGSNSADMKMYDMEKIIAEIKSGKRPMPFSEEVHGEERFYNKGRNDIFDW